MAAPIEAARAARAGLPAPAQPPATIEPWSSAGVDFRARATLGVALIALVLLLPFAVASLVQRQWAHGSGTLGILLLLGASALCVVRGRSHRGITLWALVPGGMLFMTQVIRVDPLAGTVWCYPSIIAVYCMLDQRRAWAGNAIILAAGLGAAWTSMEPALASRITATLVAVSAFSAILVRVIDVQQTRLASQVVTDALTGLYNRLPLATALDAAVTERRAHGVPASLLALDLDHFKRINDDGGHDAGDEVLRGVGALLRSGPADGRRAFRVGGEEFTVLLPGFTAAAAERAAGALCDAFRVAPRLAVRGATVSIGVATLGVDEDRRDWQRRADALLYEAKRAGRDRVVTDAADGTGGGPADRDGAPPGEPSEASPRPGTSAPPAVTV